MSEGTVGTTIDLTDSDVLVVEKVLQAINSRQGQTLALEPFRQEIIDRFAKAGFRVDVRVYTTDQDHLYAFDIEIEERLRGEFDPDQMVYEATRDILDLGEKGVIKTEMTSSGIIKPHGHKH